MLRQALGLKVGLVHGKMKAAERDAAMAAFKAGETQLLVATTVIEVGVDVPEATIMVVEHAERFGLAQLHQLRGRVGRGSGKSSCMLSMHEPLGETAKARLKTMRETDDGFVIAEEDLRLRGPGEMLGKRQSGMEEFRLADPAAHADCWRWRMTMRRLILTRDPDLKSPRGEALRVLLYLFGRDEAVRYLRTGEIKRSPPERASFQILVVVNGVARRIGPVQGRVTLGSGLVGLGQSAVGLGLRSTGLACALLASALAASAWFCKVLASAWAALAWTCAPAASAWAASASAWASSFWIWALAASALDWWRSAFACSRAIGSASAGLAIRAAIAAMVMSFIWHSLSVEPFWKQHSFGVVAPVPSGT